MSGAGGLYSGGGVVGWPGCGAPGFSDGAGSGVAGIGGSTGMKDLLVPC